MSSLGKNCSNTVPTSRSARLSAGKRSSSVIVGRTETGHHNYTIDGYSSSIQGHPTGKCYRCPPFELAGHRWCIDYFPNGVDACYADHVSLALVLDEDVKAPVKMKHAYCLAGDAEDEAEIAAWLSWAKMGLHTREIASIDASFIKRVDLERSGHLRDDSFTIRCNIAVVKECRVRDTTPLVSVPPSNILHHLSDLLETKNGADVVFEVGGETVAAHRCLLAARSTVFAAELLAPMNGVAGGGTVVHVGDIEAKAFKALIYFAYTDSLPETISKEDESVTCQHLVVAADRYNMERLKVICEEKLCVYIDVGTVATMLALAENHRCEGLKKNCFSFLATPANLWAVMATDDYKHLRMSFPSAMSSIGKKRLRSDDKILGSRSPMLTTGKRSGAVMVACTESGHHILTIDGYSSTTDCHPTGGYTRSHHFIASGHRWCIDYFPNGIGPAYVDYISLGLVLDEYVETPVKAKMAFYLADEAGEEAEQAVSMSLQEVRYYAQGSTSTYGAFIKRVNLEGSEHLRNDSFTIRCNILVIKEPHVKNTTPFVSVPPSYIIQHLGELLKSEIGTDIVFDVEGETIRAHRCLLAARSPVFAAELLGPMKEGNTVTSGVVHVGDIEAEAFKALLYFTYTDSLPEMIKEDERVACQHLLVAADKYDMERLKLICEEKLCEYIDIGNVSAILALAEQHRCKGLKKSCFDFLATSANMRTVMETEDFEHLTTSCPNIMSELMSYILDTLIE